MILHHVILRTLIDRKMYRKERFMREMEQLPAKEKKKRMEEFENKEKEELHNLIEKRKKSESTKTF